MIVSAQSRSSGGSACFGSMPCSCERFVAAWSSGKYGTSGRAGRLSSPGLRGSEYAPIEWTLYPSEESRRTWSNSSMLCHRARTMFTGERSCLLLPDREKLLRPLRRSIEGQVVRRLQERPQVGLRLAAGRGPLSDDPIAQRHGGIGQGRPFAALAVDLHEGEPLDPVGPREARGGGGAGPPPPPPRAVPPGGGPPPPPGPRGGPGGPAPGGRPPPGGP